jgi:phosphate transport system permease protein
MTDLRGETVQRQAISDQRKDKFFALGTGATAVLVLLLLAGAAGTTLYGGREAFAKFGFSFLTSSTWDPPAQQFGALAAIAGTLFSSLIALLIAVPVSFGIAMFLTELAPNFIRKPIGMAIELLAGVPSIIFGMWGLFVLVPFLGERVFPWMSENLSGLPIIGVMFQGPPIGIGIGTAGLVLSIMIIPFIASVMRDVFLTVPNRLKESAYALGSTTFEVIWHIVLPHTKAAVVGAVLLGLGRALGETMAVAFVVGNAHYFGLSLMDPATTISATIVNEFGEASDPLHVSALLATGSLLFLLTTAVLIFANLMLAQLRKREGN